MDTLTKLIDILAPIIGIIIIFCFGFISGCILMDDRKYIKIKQKTTKENKPSQKDLANWKELKFLNLIQSDFCKARSYSSIKKVSHYFNKYKQDCFQLSIDTCSMNLIMQLDVLSWKESATAAELFEMLASYSLQEQLLKRIDMSVTLFGDFNTHLTIKYNKLAFIDVVCKQLLKTSFTELMNKHAEYELDRAKRRKELLGNDYYRGPTK